MTNRAMARIERRFAPVSLSLTAAMLVLALGGCAGVHLYDAEREKLAQGAKKSFDAADVKATIAGARENQAALTEAEVAQARRLVETRRNLLLNALAGDNECKPAAAADQPAPVVPDPAHPRKPPLYERISGCIDLELKRLVVIQPPTTHKQVLDALRADVATVEMFTDAIAGDRARVRTLFKGLDLPPCVLDTAPPPTAPPTLVQKAAERAPNEPLVPFYQTFVRHCTTYRDAIGRIVARATGPDFARAAGEWKEGQTALASAQRNAADLKDKYDAALKKYEAAAAALEQGDSKDVRDKFAEALAGLKAASEALEKAGGFLGLKEISEERLDQVNAVIAALKGKELDPKQFDSGIRKAVGVVASLPAFADRAIDIARRRQAPPLGPLLLEKGLHQARLAAANRQIMREEQRLAWLERRMTAQRDRAIRLLGARQRLDQATARLAAGPPCNDDVACGQGRLPPTPVQAFSDATPAETRVRLRQSVAEFADSFSIEAAIAAEADYRLVSLEYDIALDRSEDAVQQWQTLIAVPIDRLIAYHGSGIKPAEVAAIVTQALGFAAVGVGVNR